MYRSGKETVLYRHTFLRDPKEYESFLSSRMKHWKLMEFWSIYHLGDLGQIFMQDNRGDQVLGATTKYTHMHVYAHTC